MKKAIITLAALMLIGGFAGAGSETAQAQGIQFNENWSIVTAVLQVYNSPEYDGKWVDMGVARKIGPFLGGYVSTMVRFGGISDDTPSAFGLDFYYTEALTPWLDVVPGFGLNQDLAKEEDEDKWGAAFVGSLALKFHKPKGHFFGGIGGRLFQDAPGRLEAYAIGGFIGLKL